MATSLTKKLRIQSDQRLLVLNPPTGFLSTLGDLPADVIITDQPAPGHEAVIVFVKDSTEFGQLIPQAIQSVVHDGILWVCYPKKTGAIPSDLSRDVVWEMMNDTGLRPVMQIAVDETWSALRFRPAEAVGS
ncbi:MAG: hypothetical protein J5I90_17210 [Caldilineales bacterium]|nr:hypothetical protein [Caldilineales bacterium]